MIAGGKQQVAAVGVPSDTESAPPLSRNGGPIVTLAALKQPPEIACIVVSYQSPRDMVAAVRSILVQDVPVEVVVVNSGGGEPAAALAAAGIDVPVIDHPERLFNDRHVD